eukprot:766437-Rhodomonas_salina.4
MTEEVEHLDGELDKIVAEVREGYAKLQEMKGNNTDIRTKRVDHLTERIARAKQMLKGLSCKLRPPCIRTTTLSENHENLVVDFVFVSALSSEENNNLLWHFSGAANGAAGSRQGSI